MVTGCRLALAVLLCTGVVLEIAGQTTISQVRASPVGSVVTVSGTIVNGNEFGTLRYMQDATAGIAVFSPLLSSSIEGDSVHIMGVLSIYRGELQISPVLSLVVLATGRTVPVREANTISAVSHDDFISAKVRLSCMGIMSFERPVAAGWYTMYDNQGHVARMTVADGLGLDPDLDLLLMPFTAVGIWTRIEDQYHLRLLHAEVDNTPACYYIPPGSYSFYPDNHTIRLSWSYRPEHDGLWESRLFLKDGEDIVYEKAALGFPNFFELRLQEMPAWHGRVLTAVLRHKKNATTYYTSAPLHMAFPYPGTKRPDFLFNRPVNSSFSDGSHPLATGPSVIEADIISRIDAVTSTLDIAMYNTTRTSVVEAVSRAAQRGVAVRYMADDETSNSALSGALPFTVKYRSGNGIMHHKFIAGDAGDPQRCWVWTGSTNLSANQLSSDPNHAIVLYDPALTRAYTQEFDELWGDAVTGQPPRYGDFKTDNTAHTFAIDDMIVQSFFSPSDETACHIERKLRSAHHHIEVALLLLTDHHLVDRLVSLHQNGVQVRVIVEDEAGSSSALARLRTAGVKVATHDPGSIFHHKYAIIDEGFPDNDPIVITGSHNWTWSADHINDENTLIFHDQSVANIFRQEFEARWQELNPVSVVTITDSGLEIFPNPADDYITLSHTGTMQYHVTMTDMTGKPVWSSPVGAVSAITLRCGHLAEGLYVMHMAGASGYHTVKVLIAR